jgi:sirohydrochlorin cobaltochelatase
MLRLGDLVAGAVPEVEVATGFLELSDPPAGVALEALVAAGATRIAVVPLMLNAAGHSKSDVPAVVLEGRERHPGVALHYGRPLGPDRVVLELARQRIEDAGAGGLPLAFLARGTSEPDANAEVYRAGRLVAEYVGSRLVVAGFSGITWPGVGETLEQLRRLGAEPIACFAWYLCTGLLLDRMKSDFAEFTGRTGVEIVDAGYVGPDPALVPLVLERYTEALGGAIRMNCDACSYRMPFPGLENRVGQELGHGHSHLAAEHRRHISRLAD